MEMVRVALIGLALGLLAIGLPGSEDTAARQSAPQAVVYAPQPVQTPVAVSLPNSPAFQTSPMAPQAPIRERTALSQDADVSAAPAIEPEESEPVEPQPEIIREERRAVSLVALNRSMSLEPATPTEYARPAKPATSRSRGVDLDQAEIKLTRVLRDRNELNGAIADDPAKKKVMAGRGTMPQ